ncbi:MAG: hydrolase [Thermodesulfobacteriota bacterium]
MPQFSTRDTMTMHGYHPYLQWLDSEGSAAADLLRVWAEVNSGSGNITGLSRMCAIVEDAFARLRGRVETLPLQPRSIIEPDGSVAQLPLGKVIRVSSRLEAGLRVLLNVHYDTVYGADHAFRSCVLLDDDTLQGPGVADAKGGLMVLLKALEALERTPWAGNLGWEVLINPDEEIGSPGSTPLLVEAAARHDLGLVFEPAWRDGSLVSTRKGSSVYTAIVRGRAAHAGRNPAEGRNAINAVAEFVVRLNSVFKDRAGTTLNVGAITGGGPANVVPDLASCKFNVRTESLQDDHTAYVLIEELIDDINTRDGLSAELHRSSWRPPKVIDRKTLELMGHYDRCAEDIGLTVSWRAAGGAGDGSVLASAGLPTLDGLGPIGDNLHSPEEYVVLPSLAERAKVVALLLMKLAAGEIRWERSRKGPGPSDGSRP